MNKEFTSSVRRKDYIANLALILFAVIIILEFLLVTWLPSRLSSEKIWDRQVALQEMIDLEDFLRNYIRSGQDLKYINTWQEGEAFMALGALDVLAKYVRTYRNDLTREQIQELYSTLKKFEAHYNRWDNKGFYITFEDIHIEPVLSKQMKEYREWEKTQGKTATK